MVNWIKQKLYQFYISKKYQVQFLSGISIDRITTFEGKNAVYNNTKLNGADIGLGTYIASNSILRKTKIGRFCAIGENVRTGLGMHPTKDFVSVHPAFFSLHKQAGFTFVKEQLFEEHRFTDASNKFYVEIGNDVWIGNDVMIIDGITIGNGAVVAAGAVVTKNVEPYTIVGGIPAEPIKKRFSDEQIEKLSLLEWWKKDFVWLKQNSQLFENINELLKVVKS